MVIAVGDLTRDENGKQYSEAKLIESVKPVGINLTGF